MTGRRKIRLTSPVPPLTDFDPPAWLKSDPVAVREYRRVAKPLAKAGIATPLDVTILAMYAKTYSDAVKYKRYILRHGKTQRIIGRGGKTLRIEIHPAVHQLFVSLRQLDSAGRDLLLHKAGKLGLPASITRPADRLREFANSL